VAVSSEVVSGRLQFGGSLNPEFVAGGGGKVSFNTRVFSADRFGVRYDVSVLVFVPIEKDA